MQASRQNLNFVYLQKTKILILHFYCHKNHFYPAAKFRNILNDLQTQLAVADKMKLLCCNGNQIHLVTKKILFLGQEVFVC